MQPSEADPSLHSQGFSATSLFFPRRAAQEPPDRRVGCRHQGSGGGPGPPLPLLGQGSETGVKGRKTTQGKFWSQAKARAFDLPRNCPQEVLPNGECQPLRELAGQGWTTGYVAQPTRTQGRVPRAKPLTTPPTHTPLPPS